MSKREIFEMGDYSLKITNICMKIGKTIIYGKKT
jgi:hypothetical protein